MKKAELQEAVLRLISKERRGLEIFYGGSFIQSIVRDSFNGEVTMAQFMEAIWALVAQELAYLDTSDSQQQRWRLRPTAAGEAIVDSIVPDPAAPGYFNRVRESAPLLSDDVHFYVLEALSTYQARTYTASAVMLGVASEAAFLEMAQAYASWIPGKERKRLQKILDDPRASFARKFDATRKALEPHSNDLGKLDGGRLDLALTGVAELIRINRNDAGHPTGVRITKEDQRTYLQVFVNYVARINSLIDHFTCSTELLLSSEDIGQ